MTLLGVKIGFGRNEICSHSTRGRSSLEFRSFGKSDMITAPFMKIVEIFNMLSLINISKAQSVAATVRNYILA